MQSVMPGMLKEEKERNLVMQDIYEKELCLLRKGTIKVRSRAGKKYYYLHYREGNKVKDEYIGKDESEAALIQEELNKRKHLKNVLKRLKLEYKQMCLIVKD